MSFFLCPCLKICYLSRRFAERFSDFAVRTYTGDKGAFYFDNIRAEDVRLFLLEQTYKSCQVLSKTPDIFVWLAVSSKPSSQPIWLKV